MEEFDESVTHDKFWRDYWRDIYDRWIKDFYRRRKELIVPTETFFVKTVSGPAGFIHITIVKRLGCCGHLVEMQRYTYKVKSFEFRENLKLAKTAAKAKTINSYKEYFRKTSTHAENRTLILDVLKDGPFSLDDLKHIDVTKTTKHKILNTMVLMNILIEIPKPDFVRSKQSRFWTFNDNFEDPKMEDEKENHEKNT